MNKSFYEERKFSKIFVMEHKIITPEVDTELAVIIRKNLENAHLDIPGTAYFDPELDHLSSYYLEQPETRRYIVLFDEDGQLLGGVGLAEFENIENCAEMQKLYLRDEAKGKGLGKLLVTLIEAAARELGYKKLYLETHTNLDIAIKLYERMGFTLIERPDFVQHTTMDRFFIKDL